MYNKFIPILIFPILFQFDHTTIIVSSAQGNITFQQQ